MERHIPNALRSQRSIWLIVAWSKFGVEIKKGSDMDRATQPSPAQCQELHSSAPCMIQFCSITLSTISAQIGTVSMVGLLYSPQISACFDLPSYEVLSLGPASPLNIGRTMPDILHSAKDENMTWSCLPWPFSALWLTWILAAVSLPHSCFPCDLPCMFWPCCPWRHPGPPITFFTCNPDPGLISC